MGPGKSGLFVQVPFLQRVRPVVNVHFFKALFDIKDGQSWTKLINFGNLIFDPLLRERVNTMSAQQWSNWSVELTPPLCQ